MKPAQLRRYEKLLQESIQASKRFDVYRNKLALICDHPEKYVKGWEWESDNGYEIQRKWMGKMCQICWATKTFPDATHWTRN